MLRDKCEEEIIFNLCALIKQDLKLIAHEEQYPNASPDESETKIQEAKTRVVKYRAMRHNFEVISTSITVQF